MQEFVAVLQKMQAGRMQEVHLQKINNKEQILRATINSVVASLYFHHKNESEVRNSVRTNFADREIVSK